MKINYDKVADAVYFSMSDGKVATTRELEDRLIVDLDKSGNVIGVELLEASTQLTNGGKGLEKTIKSGVPVKIVSGAPITA
jgi:uncharacterized protein YuzE